MSPSAPKKEAPENVPAGPLVKVDDTLNLPDYDPNRDDWSGLIASADEAYGTDLAKDDLLDALVGVPFIIHRLTFRKGIKRQNGAQAAYVSCEAVIAPDAILRKRRVNLDTMPFEPGSGIVFNDGSTGIYRQIVAYLANKGVIELPEPITTEGSYGETSYDLPPSGWSAINAGTTETDDDGFLGYEVNIRLACPRGLRLSEYQTDFNPNGSKTRYVG